MKITTSIEKLKNAVNLVEKMTGKNLTLPSLSAILVIASGSSIKIRSTNLNVGIEYEIPAVIEQEGVVLVKGDILNTVFNHISGGEVNLSLDNDNLVVKTKSQKTVIKCLPTDEFPTLPIVEGESFSIKSSILSEGIRSVYFCAATTDIKPEIGTIFIYSDQENIVFVATDSFRLAERKIKMKNTVEINSILIPYKNINDVLRVLDAIEGDAHIIFHKNQLSISSGNIYFTSRLINGSFPDYRVIIPKETKTKIVVLKQEFLNTLRLSTVFTDTFSHITLTISDDKKGISLESKNNDVGAQNSHIDAVIEGEPIQVTFNLKYFMDVFQSLNEDSMSLLFTEPHRPIVVKGVNDNSFLYLLMPTR